MEGSPISSLRESSTQSYRAWRRRRVLRRTGPSLPEDRSSSSTGQRWRLAAAVALGGLVIGLAVQYAIKASEEGSAFVRWRSALLELPAGVNIYQAGHAHPNPPIMPLILYPLALLPVVPGALVWFGLKVAMAILAVRWALQLAGEGSQAMPTWGAWVVVGLSLRPLMSDLTHGNVNIFILFLTVAALRAFRTGRDPASGLLLGLATACKVTPALLGAYFLYKRQWRVAAWCLVGLLLCLIVVPSIALGPNRNLDLLYEWFDLMIVPYIWEGQVEVEQINQSFPGVLARLLTNVDAITFGGDPTIPINVANLPSAHFQWLIRGVWLLVLGVLIAACRAPADPRDQWRLACEFGLVLLAMLFLSERSWKHHYVTMVVPYAAICYALAAIPLSRAWRSCLVGTLAVSALLMATTSSEIGQWLLGAGGHKYAQGYGAFLLAGLVVFVALTALLVRSPRAQPSHAEDPL